MAKAKKPPVKYYRIRRAFFNGRTLCEAGSIQPFPEGREPRDAVLVDSEELKAEAVVKENAQDLFITRVVERHLEEVLPNLVAEAVAHALEAEGAKEKVPPTSPTTSLAAAK